VRGDREHLDQQQEPLTRAARRLRLAEAEALAALDALRAELHVSTHPAEGYGLPLDEAATLAGLDGERAERMVAAHQGQVQAARAAVDADAAVARWTRAGKSYPAG